MRYFEYELGSILLGGLTHMSEPKPDMSMSAFARHHREQVARIRLQMTTSEHYRDQLRRVNLPLHRIFLARIRTQRQMDTYLFRVLYAIVANVQLIGQYEEGILKYRRRLLELSATLV